MSDLESLKRVLMATKDKARGMKKAKYEKRINPEPEAVSPTEEVEAEASEEMEAAPLDDEDPDKKEALREAIRELLAKV